MATEDSTTTIEEEESSPFQAQAEYKTSAADVYQKLVDDWVVAPMKVLWSDYRGRFGLSVLVIYVLMGTVGVLLVEQPRVGAGPLMEQPFQTMEYPLGTDGLGQDMLGLMVHSTPDMFRMIIAGAIFANALGVVVGLVSGYMGGNVDKILMTIADTIGSIPGLPLLLVLAALIQPTNPWLVGIVLSVQAWAGLARNIRAQVLPIRKKEYVEASKSIGQPTSSVLLKDVLPELMPLIAIGFMSGATGIIHASVGLYFLGVLPFENQNWGVVLNDAYQQSGALYSTDAAHWLLVPMITITGLTFALTLLAQASDQIFNPRVRARHLARKRAEEAPDEPTEEEVSDISTQMGRM